MANQSKTIVVGVTGGIAAYKTAEVVRGLIKDGFAVHVMMTAHAQQFVTPLTFQTLSKNPVATDMFLPLQEHEIGHVKLADVADVVLVCPATANIMAKAAQGICDDFVSTVLLATTAPKVFVPSMNVHMFEHPATQQNMKILVERGCFIMEPATGELACGYEGKGRLPDPEAIIKFVKNL